MMSAWCAEVTVVGSAILPKVAVNSTVTVGIGHFEAVKDR